MYGRWNAAGYGPAHKRMGHGFERYGFGGYRRPKYNVPVNIEEKEDHYELTVYATGFDKENIKLSVVEDVLYITGTRTIDENNKPNFTKQEFPVKSFERVISLNGQVDTTGIKARQENNILIVTLPKTAEAQRPAQEISVD
jgi:HSP20 family protein